MPTVALNWVDILSIVLLIFSVIEGWRLGFIQLSASFGAYAIAFLVSMKYHKPVGAYLVGIFGIPRIWTDSVGYIFLITLALILFTKLFLILSEKIVTHFIHSIADRLTGVIISFFNACIILVFVFVAIAAIPDALPLKEGVAGSTVAQIVLNIAKHAGGNSFLILEQSISDNARFITIDPESTETLHIPFTLQRWNLLDDMAGATQMITHINTERAQLHLVVLREDAELSDIALAYSRDMFERKYFSHTSPEGNTMKERLEDAHVSYIAAAENLAFAPDITTAHIGLMNSPPHKAAILDPVFIRVGVGVVDGGSAGIMVTELFAH